MFTRHLVKLWDLPQAMQHVGHHHNLVFFAVWGCNAECGLPSARRFWSNAWPKRTFSLKASEILALFFVIICQMAGTFHKCLSMSILQSAPKRRVLRGFDVCCLDVSAICSLEVTSGIQHLLLWVFPLLTPTPHYWPGGDVMSGCYHLQSRYLYQFTWIHRIALNLLGKRDRQLNTMASLWHHYGITMVLETEAAGTFCHSKWIFAH